MIRNSFQWLGVAVLCFLTGCATTPQAGKAGQMTPEMYQRLLVFNDWHITGKLGYRDSSQAGSAWFNWRQQNTVFELGLRGPFGAGATQITGSEEQASLIRSGHEPVIAVSASALTEHLFGWQWPVDDLLYWVKGIPAPNTPSDKAVYDSRQLLTKLEQSGWSLQFSHYTPTDSGLLLPGKITGQYQQRAFTLLIKEWLLAPQ